MFLLCALLLAADISGSYTGTLTMQAPDGERKRPTAIVIKQSAETLAVTFGPNLGEQHPASNVKIEGDKLTFEIIPPGADRPAMTVDLKAEADRLTGTMVITPRDGQSRTGKIDLKKQ